MTSIAVLGPVAIEDSGAPLSPRDRVVLSVLVTHRGHEVSSDTLAEALWGDHPPASATKVVQGCIARLRRRLGSAAIRTSRGGYLLSVPAEEVDAGRFERLVQRARDLLALGHADQAAYAADEALALWRGRPLTDLEEWEPGRGESQRLTELRLQAEELRLAALLTSGRHGELLAEATLRVREEPLRERRWAFLARAQYQDGQQAEALATLRRARDVLTEELGLDPGQELVDLERAVLQQDPALAVEPSAVASSTCPWPGLAPFDVDEADSYFGRDAELAECLERLTRVGLLAVVGASGSGKSSLVRAGLAARLRDQGRAVRVVTPGPHPADTLTDALAELGPEGVLVVDQCEEVLTGRVPEAVRAAFLDRLVEHASTGPVVLTLRADRLGSMAAYPLAARLVEEGLYLLGGMDERALRQTIEGPAHRAGLLLEPGLVDLLVRDVEGEPGSLPLLAHALRQTWERREGSTLTVDGYRESGRIRGAIAQSAEQVYEAATPDQRHVLRELLLRMVQPGPGGEPVRTSVARDVVMSEREPAELIEQLVEARLLTTHEDRVEIAHEALVRAWPRLQAWLADDVQGERIRHHLAAAAEAWEVMGRPGSELYRGARLAAAREWHAGGSHRLSRVEQDFLAASEAAHQSRLARAEQEARRQRGVARRLRVLVVGVTVLALVAAVFGLLAYSQNDRARSQRLSAAALAVLDRDPALAKALAVLGAESAPPGLGTTALHRTFAEDRVISRLSMHRDTQRLWAVLSPDGKRVAMTAEHVFQPALAIEVHDAVTGALVWEWVPPAAPEYSAVVVAGAQYAPDGSVLVAGVVRDPASTMRRGGTALDDARPPDGSLGVRVWDADNHEEIEVVDVGPCGGWPLAVGGDRMLVRTLVAQAGMSEAEEASLLRECRWLDGAMGTLLVDRSTGEQHLVSVTEALNLHLTVGHAITDDGAYAVVPDFSNWSAVLLDGATGEELGRILDSVAHDFDPKGQRLLTVDVKGRGTDLWTVLSVPALETETLYTGRSAWSFYGRFAPDGATVWTTGVENTLVQWDASTGRHLRALPAIGGGVPTTYGDVVLVPRPETAGAVLVDVSPPGEPWSVPSCGGNAGKGRLHVTQKLIVVGRDCGATPDGHLETFTRQGTPVDSWPGVSWETLAVSPDGRQVVARDGAGLDEGDPQVGALTVRDLDTGRPVVELEGFCRHTLPDFLTGVDVDAASEAGCSTFPQTPFSFATWTVTWSPDQRLIAALDGGVAVWDAGTGDLVEVLPDAAHGGPAGFWPYDARFSPNSAHLIVTTQERAAVAFDTTTWLPVLEESMGLQSAYSAGVAGFASDGSVVVVTPLYQVAASTAVLVLDPDRLTVRQVWTGVADGAVQAAEVSPDGTRIALATSEGLVTIWDLASRSLVDEADLGVGALEGVRWLDDSNLVLLSATGDVTTVTTDAALLLELNRESMTRGLAPTECASYDIDPCPGLNALKKSAPVVPDGLRGTYSLIWDADELKAAMLERVEVPYGPLDPSGETRLGEQADLLAGTYLLELGAGDYTISKGDTGEIWCTGSVTGRGDRLLLGAFGGSRCSDFHYAEIGWELDGDQLSLPREQFRGRDVDTVLWTTKPLQRIS